MPQQTTLDWLSTHRPDLAERYVAALPAARAAVLGRLWGALAREPLPGMTAPPVEAAGRLTVTVNGHTLRGPAAAARPFAPAPPGLTINGTADPGRLAATLWPHSPTFAAELDDSVTNLALARAAAGTDEPDDLVTAEQSIVDGHPLHPCCRTRLGMDTADVLAYAPEHRPAFDAPVIAVPPERWHSTGTGLPPRLLMHPWQWRRLNGRHPWLIDTGSTVAARPLMSLRTLATPTGHVKTAIDVQMTSATRTVSAAAVHNGPVLSALLRELTRHTAGLETFDILDEPAGGAVLVDGVPYRGLAVVHRAAPRLAPIEKAAPFATLTAGRPHATDLIAAGYDGDPEAFLTHLSGLLLPPLFTLLDLGVAVEAHGQNLILVTAHGRACRILYRDFGGVRVSPDRLRQHGIAAPPLHGDIPNDDPEALVTKVVAAAVATVLAGLVATLADRYGIEPDRLWKAVSAPKTLADRPTLPLKAMTAMRLAGTTDDIWTTVANPIAGPR